jgi:hypothetical protein
MRAGFSPQSELGPGLMGLAPPYGLATHCPDHCNTSVAQGIRGPCGFDVIPSFLPAHNQQSWQSPIFKSKFQINSNFKFENFKLGI